MSARSPTGRPSAGTAGWFGPAEGRCFGWFHAPAEVARPAAVLLCPPFGQELLATHRAYLRLAERLAAMGFPVMRFDYPGTGDAPGGWDEPSLAAAWQRGIGAAMTELRLRSGLQDVALFGMRLGATLATVAAAERGDVGALALFAPCASGSSFLRELRAAREARAHHPAGATVVTASGAHVEQLPGLFFGAETVTALEALDPCRVQARPATRVLVVPRDDQPGEEGPLVGRLSELGTRVEVRAAPGYGASVSDDPHFVESPERVWDAVSAWLDEAFPPVPSPAAPAVRSPQGPHDVTMTTEGAAVRESVARFGEGGRLFGILAEPVAGQWRQAVILANTGANPRAGAGRFGVALARSLAARGIASLRMDLGGLGDSPPPEGARENHLYAPHSIADVRAAVDFLCDRARDCAVAVAGLSSGGYVSFHAALADSRIRAVIVMNTLVFEFRTDHVVDREVVAGYRSARYYKQTAFRLETWVRVLRGRVNVLGIASTLGRKAAEGLARSAKRTAVWVGLEALVMTELARQFDALLKRGTRVLVVFNGDEPMSDRFERDLGALSRTLRARGLRVEWVDGADHVFGSVASQERVKDLVSGLVLELGGA